MITAGLAFLVVSDTSERAADEEVTDIAFGRTGRLAIDLQDVSRGELEGAVSGIAEPGFSVWVVNRGGELITPPVSPEPSAPRSIALSQVPQWRRAVNRARAGRRYLESYDPEEVRGVRDEAGPVTVAAAPIRREVERGGTTSRQTVGAVVTRSVRSSEVDVAIEAAEGDRLTALVIAIGVALLLSFLVASAITTRVKRLADSATRITEGRLEEPLEGTGGRDEITDLGRSLETMREALRGTFTALRSERDRLTAIFDALGEAVLVVEPTTGEIRFSNPAAADLITAEGTVIDPLVPWFRRAHHRGSAEHDSLLIGERVYAINAREVRAEGAVLAVVRDRTDELQREVAEREFVSNAAHELRNPIAGISGAIEVLQAGAKDDPDARDLFLARLSEDVERISRLTEALLMLARMESVGEGGVEPFDVAIAVEEATATVVAPEDVELAVELSSDLVAQGDPVLMRQVLVGLLTNAFKHTPSSGKVTIAGSVRDGGVVVEVSDTGPGIAHEDVERIFERFYRGEKALERSGFGLGLSIAKRMVDIMGGDIGVDSEPKRGSTFWVRLPAAKPAATPVA